MNADLMARKFIAHCMNTPSIRMNAKSHRVTEYVGVLFHALERLGANGSPATKRTFRFSVPARGSESYIAKFDHHQNNRRGGIVFIREATGEVVNRFTSVDEAVRFYNDPSTVFCAG